MQRSNEIERFTKCKDWASSPYNLIPIKITSFYCSPFKFPFLLFIYYFHLYSSPFFQLQATFLFPHNNLVKVGYTE